MAKKPAKKTCDYHRRTYRNAGEVMFDPHLERQLNDRLDIEKKVPCREGVVIGSAREQRCSQTGERKIVKLINPAYLLNKNNSDEH